MAKYDITPDEFVTKQIESGRLVTTVDGRAVLGVNVDVFRKKQHVSRESLQQIMGWEFMNQCDKVLQCNQDFEDS